MSQNSRFSLGGDESTPLLTGVTRAFSILETLSHYPRINLERLAAETGLPKPTVFRFLNTLRDLGYVHRDPQDQYASTLKMFSLGSRALDHLDLYHIIRPVAEKLSEDLKETVHVGVLDDDEGVYILKIESKYTLRMYSRVGKRIPLYCTAIGKCLLAGLDSERLESYLDHYKPVPFTPNTIKDPESLKKEVVRVRSQAWAEDGEEHEQGIRCIGVPVLDHKGSTLAAVSVSWPTFRFENQRAEEYQTHIQQAGREISYILGWEPAGVD
ncbi:MAG: IclR family transcriptional regulator [Spirochaetales bacterium]|nr:IclR family transcriptional regulator [Spirochaetales bacterium]